MPDRDEAESRGSPQRRLPHDMRVQSPLNWPGWAQYALALGTILAALAFRRSLDPVVGPGAVPFVSVFGALLVLVLVLRTGPFLFATLLGGLGGWFFFVEPSFSFRPEGSAQVWQMVLFGVSGAAAVIATSLSRRARGRRAEAERDAARKGQEIRLVIDAVPALIAYVDASLRYRFVNARYAEWFDLPAEEIVGRRMKDVLTEPAYALAHENARAALRGEHPRFTMEVPHRDGGTRRLAAESAPHVLEDGSVVGFIVLVSDVTDRQRAETAQAQLAAIVETSGDAITSISLDGVFLTWNAGAERLFGYAPEEAIGRDMDLIFPPDRAQEEREILREVREGRVVGPYDTVRRTRDGRDVDVSVTVSPIRDAHGVVIGASKVDRDLADRLAAERALRASEKALRTARARERSYLDHLPVGVWFADEDGTLVYGNEAARTIWGEARMVGPEDYEVFEAYWHGTDQRISGTDWALHRALTRGERSLGEVIDIVAFDGERRTMLNSAVPVRDEDGRIVGGVVMNLDITDLKRAEAALQEADRRKDEFLATLSHELRNPLAAIHAASALMTAHGCQVPGPVEQAARTVQRQVDTMTRLVDDLLDVSRITRGKLELRRTHVALGPLLREAIDAVAPSIDRNRHTVETRMPREPVHVEGDAVRLVQVFTNLLSNACDYTESGGRIDIELRQEGAEAVVEIRDDGRGIPADELPSIFEMFTRLGSGRTRPSGLGIGLPLSRRLVEMHGGTLTADSEGPGRGTLMTVRLPSSAPAPNRPPDDTSREERSSPQGLDARRILLVEDNVDVATALATLLENHGHQVRAVHDGLDALREGPDFLPHVVLLDLGLPDLDGIDVCRRLRREPWGRTALVVAVSGWGQDADRQRTAEAGFDAHLTKPAGVEQILALIEERDRRTRPGSGTV